MDSPSEPPERRDDAPTAHEAKAELERAVRAASGRALIVEPEPGDPPAAVVAVFTPDAPLPPMGIGLDQEAVLPDTARAFQTALATVGVSASVRVVEVFGSALRVAFQQPADASTFARLVLSNLPEPHASAHRLAVAFTRAGIPEVPHPYRQWVSLGNVSVTSALTLCTLLGSPDVNEGLEREDWRELEELAGRIASVLSRAVGAPLEVGSDPVCTRCSGENEMEIGGMTPGQAQRVAQALDDALAVRRDAEPSNA